VGLIRQCERFLDLKERRVSQESGFFGIGADFEKIRKIRMESNPACDQLRAWGIGTSQQQRQPAGFF
jgi:DnaJ family protein B protein 12